MRSPNHAFIHPLHRALPLALASALAIAVPTALMPATAIAQVLDVSVNVAPPPLPVYEQPIIPDDGYVWAPGYWAWGPDGYFWVPGTWVQPPELGLLWTPGYWAWDDGAYFWHAGYWGPTVGFYGGINYGYGYPGIGYYGGHWDHDHFFYNRAVNNFGSVHITNVYNDPVRNVSNNHIAFNGGHGGINARPTAAEDAAARDHHVDATTAQTAHARAAGQNHASLASVNHGSPAVAATAHAGNFSGAGVVHARGAGATPAHNNAVQPAAAPVGVGGAPQQHQHQSNAARPAAAPAGTGGTPQQHQHQNFARPNAQPGATPQARTAGPAAVTHAPQQHAAPVHPASAPAARPAGAPHPQATQHQAPVHPAAAPRPAPAPHAAPAAHPAPAARPAPAAHPAPAQGGDEHHDEHPHP